MFLELNAGQLALFWLVLSAMYNIYCQVSNAYNGIATNLRQISQALKYQNPNQNLNQKSIMPRMISSFIDLYLKNMHNDPTSLKHYMSPALLEHVSKFLKGSDHVNHNDHANYANNSNHANNSDHANHNDHTDHCDHANNSDHTNHCDHIVGAQIQEQAIMPPPNHLQMTRLTQ
jgi:hypothetical protein